MSLFRVVPYRPRIVARYVPSRQDTVSGTVNVTNANDTVSAAGTTTIVGTLAYTNVNDTSAASGTTTVLGTLARTNADDTSAASGTTTVVGSSSTTNADDSCSASGSVNAGVTGTVAYTNADDTSAASGTTTVTGTSSTTNADDTAAASGYAGTISGTVAYTNNDDTALAYGETPRVSQGGVPGGPTRRQRREVPYVAYIDGRRIIGSRDEIEGAIREFAEAQAKRAITKAKEPKKPRIVVKGGKPAEAGETAVAESATDDAALQQRMQEHALAMQAQVRELYLRTYAAAMLAAELDDEEALLLLL